MASNTGGFGKTHELQKIEDKPYEDSEACYVSNIFSCLMFRGVLGTSNTIRRQVIDHLVSETSHHEPVRSALASHNMGQA